MGWKTPPALVPSAVATALTLVIAACGGGSTGGPVARPGVPATTLASPPVTTQPAPVAPASAPATTSPARSTAAGSASRPAPPSRAARPRASGGAAAPSPAAADGSLADAGDAPAPTAKPAAPAPAEPAEMPLDERADLILTRRVSPAHYFQQGTVTGTYDGTMDVEARITAKGVLVRFTATLPGGTISGRGVAVAILDSATWPGLRGTAVVTGGTGRFAGIHGRRLQVTGRSKPDASHTRVRLRGTVSR